MRRHAMLVRLDHQHATPGVPAGQSAMNRAYLKIFADTRDGQFHQLAFAEPLPEEQVALLEAPSNHDAEYAGALQEHLRAAELFAPTDLSSGAQEAPGVAGGGAAASATQSTSSEPRTPWTSDTMYQGSHNMPAKR